MKICVKEGCFENNCEIMKIDKWVYEATCLDEDGKACATFTFTKDEMKKALKVKKEVL